MKSFVVLNKKIGETPLTAIQNWKKQNPVYASVPASYAGRLDPMASGKLLILLGEECKKQKDYTRLDKEYEIEVLLDAGSDTGDALGIPEFCAQETRPTETELAAVLRRELGTHRRAYPAFSSKTVNGKPLFLHTLEGTLSPAEIPEHEEHIYRTQFRDSFIISGQELQTRISKFLDLVPRSNEPSKKRGNDFRVDSIRALWESSLKKTPAKNFTVLRLRVTCASGTYMRSLAGRIGIELGTKGLALSIKRTRIGTYLSLFGRLGFWQKTY